MIDLREGPDPVLRDGGESPNLKHCEVPDPGSEDVALGWSDHLVSSCAVQSEPHGFNLTSQRCTSIESCMEPKQS